MKLYSSPFSSNARKVRLAAALLDIPLELVEVNLGQGAQRKPEFLAINASAQQFAPNQRDASLMELNGGCARNNLERALALRGALSIAAPEESGQDSVRGGDAQMTATALPQG
jgi:hypothetical protein